MVKPYNCLLYFDDSHSYNFFPYFCVSVYADTWHMYLYYTNSYVPFTCIYVPLNLHFMPVLYLHATRESFYWVLLLHPVCSISQGNWCPKLRGMKLTYYFFMWNTPILYLCTSNWTKLRSIKNILSVWYLPIDCLSLVTAW